MRKNISAVLGTALRITMLSGLSEVWAAEAPASASAPASARPAFGAAPGPAMSGVPAWFGLLLPPAMSDPATSVLDGPLDLPTIPPKFGPGPTSPILAGDKLKADLATIVGFSLKSKASGDYLWGRVAGTPAYYETVSWAVNSMKAGGVKNAHLEDFTTSLTIPTAGELRLIGDAAFGAGTKDIVLGSAMIEGAGPINGTVTAPMIFVGHASEADLVGRDVKGKIAVLHSNPNPGLYSTDEVGRPAALIKAGAVGVIEILDQVGNMQSFDSDRHGCTPNLCVTIGGADGYFLENMLGKAATAGKAVSAKLSSTAAERTGLKVANGVATIPGKTDRTIIINAHADAWFVGGDDNGGGLAVAVALAKYFATQPQPDHTLVFVISSGHHTQARGLPQFRKTGDNEKKYVANADLIINLEHVASQGMIRVMGPIPQDKPSFGRPTAWASTEWPKHVGVSNRAPFLIDIWKKGVTCFGLSVQRFVDTRNPGEPGAFNDLKDVPITSMISVGPLYQTSGEGVDAIPAEGLERAARFHAYMIKEADKAAPGLLKGAAYNGNAACPQTP